MNSPDGHSKLGIPLSDESAVDDPSAGEIKLAEIKALLDQFPDMPIVDTRSADEILGYNEFGLFDEEGDFSLTDVEIA